MGFGSILGSIAGSIIGGPAGGSIGGTLGGLIDGGMKGPAKPENAATYSYIPSGVTGKGLEKFNTINMPDYPTLPGYGSSPMLPSSIATMPAQYMGPTVGEKKMGQSIDASQILALAALQPDHPLVRQLAGEEEQLANMDFASALRDMMVGSRRQQAQGRTGYFNPERGDSDIMSSVMNMAARNRVGGRMAARDRLSGASGTMRDIATSYGALAGQETGRRNTFLEMLKQKIGQLRDDTYARTGTAQNDFINRYNQQRQDIMGPFNYQAGNATNAMNSANKAGQATMSNVQDYQARKAGTNAATTAGIGDLLGSQGFGDIWGKIFGTKGGVFV